MLTDDQLRYLRLRAQHLLPGSSSISIEELLAQVGGLQAQELPAALLSAHARAAGLRLGEIEQARLETRSIVRTWCLRGTLHLVTAADARWLVPFLGPGLLAGDRRRMAELGWDEERTVRGLSLLRAALAKTGGLTRPEIIALLRDNSLPYEGQAPVHLIFAAACQCLLIQGPQRSVPPAGGEHPSFVPFEDWIGAPQPLPRAEALARLARRYLAAYAPAALEDFASWSGLRSGDARAAWASIESERAPVETSAGRLWLLQARLPWLEAQQSEGGTLWTQVPVVRLLPKFDTCLLGYAGRDLIVAPHFAARVHPGGGIINSTLLVDGRIQGTWSIKTRRSGADVLVALFETLGSELLPLLEAEVESLGKFLEIQTELKIV